MKFYPLDVTYKIKKGAPVVELYGKSDREKVCVQVEGFSPYFWVIGKKPQHPKIVSTEKHEKNLLDKKVEAYKCSVAIPADVPEIRDKFESFEADILYTRRYLIDNNISPLAEYEVEGKEVNGYRCKTILADKIVRTNDAPPKLSILAVDIETHTNIGKDIVPEQDPIIMIALYGKNYRKVLTWKKFKNKLDYIEVLEDEKAMLERFREIVKEKEPDILTGYFSDNFDLPYIKKRAEKLKVTLDVGVDGSDIMTGRGKFAEASIVGIAHLDMYRFISRIFRFQFESFKLDYVADKLLGSRKIGVDITKLYAAWSEEDELQLAQFAEYNMVDAKLVYELCELMLPQVIEFSKLINIPPAAVSRMSFSQLVEWHLIKEAARFNQIVPNKPSFQEERERRKRSYEGGFVFEPKPGLYQDVAVFDFRSLYPTIISAHNVSPDTLIIGKDSSDGVLKDMSFSDKKGFISSVIEDIIHYRLEVKKQSKAERDNAMLKARDSALKTILNSIYGYFGFFAARWYSIECAQAITAYGRYHIQEVIKQAEKKGLKVLYSDTDSVFIGLQGKGMGDVEAFVKEINAKLPGIMELEFEALYKAGVFVAAKGSEAGAKKRYAMLSEDGSMKVRGFETVRRNLSLVAKESQEKVLRMVLEGESKEKIETYIKDVVKKLRDKKMPLSKVVITTQLSRDIKAYANMPPHVKVAMDMKKKGTRVGMGTTIKYVVTAGSKLVRDRAKLPEDVKEGEYDPEYYIDNQVMPAVERILDVLDLKAADVSQKHKQHKLDGFFT